MLRCPSASRCHKMESRTGARKQHIAQWSDFSNLKGLSWGNRYIWPWMYPRRLVRAGRTTSILPFSSCATNNRWAWTEGNMPRASWLGVRCAFYCTTEMWMKYNGKWTQWKLYECWIDIMAFGNCQMCCPLWIQGLRSGLVYSRMCG